MNRFLFDASALLKRYAPGPGTILVNHLFSSVGPARIVTLMLGVAEVVAALVRKRNAGKLPAAVFASSLT